MHASQSEVGATLYRLTSAQWRKMTEAGVFSEVEDVELLQGLPLVHAALEPSEGAAISRLKMLLARALPTELVVCPRYPFTLEPDCVLAPDISVLHVPSRQSVRRRRVLVVEVASTTLAYDRGMKLPVYARAGIPEAWIVDVAGKAVEVYSGPMKKAGAYKAKRVVASGQVLTSRALLSLKLKVADLFR